MVLRAVTSQPASAPLYGLFTLSTNQTSNLGIGNYIRFDGVEGTLPLSNGVITLPAGRVYRLSASLSVIFSGADSIGFRWYNVTSGQYIGRQSFCLTASNTSHLVDQPNAVALVTASTDVQVRLNIASQQGGLATTVNADSSYAEILQIA